MTRHKARQSLSILQVLEPSGGGSGRHLLDLCRGLKERGHRVVAVYSPLRAEERFVRELSALGLAGVRAVPMTRAPGPSDLKAWRMLNAVIRDDGPFDAIHAHSSKAGALTRLRLPGAHIPRVYTPHAFRTMDPTLGRAGRLIFGTIESLLGRFLSDRIVCVSQNEQAHAKSLGIPARRLATVVNGVSPPPTGHGSALRERLGIPHDSLLYGFVGRLSHQKAPNRLLDAFDRIAGAHPCARLLMIGAGELESEVRTRIAASPFATRIHLEPGIPGTEAMDAFDALVMPSRYEAMSYVMLEAAAAGKPMILTDVGGAACVLDDGLNGLLVPNTDAPEALAAAMAVFAAPDSLHAFTREASRRKHRYALGVMVDGIESIYRTLVPQRSDIRALTPADTALVEKA